MVNTARAALALLLIVAVPVRAETTTDPLWYLLSTHALTPDAKAIEAANDGSTDAKGLASLQSDLLLLSDGLESFRDEGQAKETLARLGPRMSPELRPFFRDRSSGLDAVYRTLAVADYTWAGRFPEPPCGPSEKRAALLSSQDGLFTTAAGEASPWLVSLLGPNAAGKTAAQALDQASAKTRLASVDYEKKRARARKLTLALASDQADGAARARLYCARATVYGELAAHHRVNDAGLIQAARSAASRPEESVFVVVWKDQRAAGTLLQTKSGPVLLTDASVVSDTDRPFLFAYSGSTRPVEMKATVVRRQMDLGLAVLAYTENQSRPALALAEIAPEKDELVTALGHTTVAGLWTKTSGLVTKTSESSFQTDAAISPELTGGPVLNEAGGVAGLLVLRRADTEEGRWPVAIPAPVLAHWLENPETEAASSAQTESIEDAGTAAVLSRTRPNALTEAGLGAWSVPGLPPPPRVPNGVCVQNCGGSSSYSGGSSYDSSGAGELGRALGEALVPIVKTVLFQGIPALFRKIGTAFSKSKTSPAATRSRTEARELPKVQLKPKEPPTLSNLTLEAAPLAVAPGDEVTLTAFVTLSDGEASKEDILVGFKATPATLLRFKGKPEARTDAAGRATIVAIVRRDNGVRTVKNGDTKALREKSNSAQSELDAEVRAMNTDSFEAEESAIAARTDENIELEARVTVRKSLTAMTSVVLSNAPAKPTCKFEPVSIPEAVGEDSFTVSVRLTCTEIEGQTGVKLDGHELTLTIGQDPQYTATLRTDAKGYATAIFQAGDADQSTSTPSTERAPDSHFINAANPGPAVLERAEKAAVNPETQKYIVKGLRASRFPVVGKIALAATGAVLVGDATFSAWVDWKVSKDQEKYEKGKADFADRSSGPESRGNEVSIHIQMYSQSGKGTRRFEEKKYNVSRTVAQEMLTRVRKDAQNNLSRKEMFGFWGALSNASRYLAIIGPGIIGRSKSFPFGEKGEHRIDIEIKGWYPYGGANE
ncbi:MAG: trypsin-like peptidase domain-containing protein [Elusimicrobia bacterium]|nr:trypsin-like peptidase domain-containing protein [Elusimicrobiota bacterium]